MILAFHLVAGPWEAPQPSRWFAVGTASAEAILHGQWWRAVTALTLHADLLHLFGNAVASLIFVAAVGRALGTGFGAALILLAGAAANLATAAVHRSGHLSVGASTATFAALGIMAGLGILRRYRSLPQRRRAWLPIGAGLGLFAMLGVGEHSDVVRSPVRPARRVPARDRGGDRGAATAGTAWCRGCCPSERWRCYPVAGGSPFEGRKLGRRPPARPVTVIGARAGDPGDADRRWLRGDATPRAPPRPATPPRAAIDYPWIPDQGDGTYRNPIIFADYSDPDVIRAGDRYYLVASSFTSTPALPILRSRDLVNWTIVGHALENLPDDRYAALQPGAGVWAPAIREHAGTFYIFAPLPDEGIYVLTAPDPEGPVERRRAC